MKLALIGASIAVLAGCSGPTNVGTQGVSTVSNPNVTGTVFTIIFENEAADTVITPSNPNFWKLSHENGTATSYVSTTHPSLPNYIMLTSGSTNGVITDGDPKANVVVGGNANLADQLDAAKIPWRAYMEDMGPSCNFDSTATYSAHHDPFLYYQSMTSDPQRCSDHVVDFAQNFQSDLDSGAYKYMWITPNMCNDMHNCSGPVADAWLGETVAKITASKAYQNGGAIFILFDEGSLRILGSGADLATIVMSPNLVSPSFVSSTFYDHRSYLATIEDIFGMPRLPTTVDATPMSAFFLPKPAVP
jgi:phosphatidylinositol-3-phosphatase